MNTRLFTTLMLGAFALGMSVASEKTYTYAPENAVKDFTGTEQAEVYNVAISLSDPGMEGAKVKSISVKVPNNAKLTNPSGWLTSALKVGVKAGKRQNLPDLATVDATITDGVLTAVFTEPVTVPEGGLYAGYSITVEEITTANNAPIAVFEGVNPGSLYIYTSRKYMSWSDRSAELGFSSPMEVVLEGDFPDNAYSLSAPSIHRYCYKDASFRLPVYLVNHGDEELKSVEYSYSSPAGSGNGSYTLPQPVKLRFGHGTSVDLEISDILVSGTSQMEITLTKVNGKENGDKIKTASLETKGYSVLPVNRPLVEEYTGLWCGYCPRGIAGMEHMRNNYPDQFVGVSFHDGDAMTIMARDKFPCVTNTFPCAWINRKSVTDPYFGDDQSKKFGFDKVWLKNCADFVPVAIDAEAHWNADDPDQVDITTKVTFVEPTDKKYRIGYYLICDALENPNWLQYNYFTGWDEMFGIEEMERFIDGDFYFAGEYFNDVVVMTSPAKGVENSLPAEIEPNLTYEHTYSFDSTLAYSMTGGTYLLQDREFVKIVAFLIEENAAANIVNSCAADVRDLSSAPAVGADEDVVSVEYYSLEGYRVASPEKGIFVKVETLADGSRKSSKVCIR